MPWRIVHFRDRTLMVSGADAGQPTFTRHRDQALAFPGQAAARNWMARNTLSPFGMLALLRDTGRGPAAERELVDGNDIAITPGATIGCTAPATAPKEKPRAAGQPHGAMSQLNDGNSTDDHSSLSQAGRNR